MPDLNPTKLKEWAGGAWTQQPVDTITSVVHDSRSVQRGGLYVAIKGNRFDGHRFLSNVRDAGAVAAITQRGCALDGFACLEVDEPLTALQAIAREYRKTLSVPIVGITGSAGKTTVKEMLSAILSVRGRTCATPGNWNNHIGLPLSILQMDSSHVFGVFEAGMNHPGEIAELAGILSPTIGLVTSIGAAHIGAFENVEGIAEEKSDLLKSVPETGEVVLDADSPWFDLFSQKSGAQIHTCSLDNESDLRGDWLPEENALRINDDWQLSVPLPGEHMQRNVLLAACTAGVLGLSPCEINEGLTRFAPAPMRWEEIERGDQLWINDAYNANPLSMRAAINAFATLQNPEKWLILGSMQELGASSRDEHNDLGTVIAQGEWAGIITVGSEAVDIFHGLRQAGSTAALLEHVDHAHEAAHLFEKNAGAKAALLIKASRVDRMERVIEELSNSRQDEG